MSEAFSFSQAFARNIGWVTPAEQDVLRHKRVAIAGMGGVGGVHLLTLARLGIGAFHIADFDVFDIVNFNRQVGATVSSIGKPKVDVLAAMARDINPEVDIKIFPQGVDESNMSTFLAGADVYIDGLDFFAFAARRATFAACARFGIPAITAAPLGMGTALLNFLPGKMSFESIFSGATCPTTRRPCGSWSDWRHGACIVRTWSILRRSTWPSSAGRRASWPASSAPAWPRRRR